MASGKTTLGRMAAERMGVSFCDLDETIERATGKSIAELFAEGEESFRRMEYDALAQVLRECAAAPGAVVALGGGTWMHPASRALLGDAPVIFLEVPVEVLAVRVELSPERPLARDPAQFRALHDERLPHYRRAAYVLRFSGEASAEEDAQELVEFIRGITAEGAGAPRRTC